MSRTAALFGKVLDHIEADEDLKKQSRKLFNAIHNGGLGHALWGSKPSQLLTKDQADLLNWLQQGYNLKDNFLLGEAKDVIPAIGSGTASQPCKSFLH